MGNTSGRYLRETLRTVLILLFLSLLPLQHVYCQETLPSVRITVSSRNQSINGVLDEITLQSGYHFTFDASIIDGKRKVEFRVRELLLKEALDSLLKDPNLDYRTIDKNIVIYRINEGSPTPISSTIDRALLRGRVVEMRTGKALSYATIALLETSLGTITNQEGEFSFKLPLDLPDPMIVVSFIGYNSKVFPVSYPLAEKLEIQLERELIPLQEVIIRYSDPAKLLREAISRFPENYLENHSTMTAFYRESVKRNDHWMVYSEAVLEVAKAPYGLLSSGDHIRIVKQRKITDVSTEDTVLIKLRSGIPTSLNLDVIKNRPDFLKEDFQSRYNLEFTDMMSYGDRLVYVISFHQKDEIPDLLFQGQLYLDQESLALLAADFEFNPDLLHKEPELFLVSRSPKINIRPVMARYHVDYRSVESRYYVSQVRGEVELKVRKKRKWFGSRYKIAIEMAITDLIPDQRLRIDPADRVSRNIVLADEPFQFDPEFWGVHNSIEPEASLMESVQKLVHNNQEIME
ncbi:MAG: carboxypeptidase-like regulatory domain-containing protein [Bacteroidales bacterium]|nr:carboxypeptidase-like regulatory domain-containing protein [Bacteroidales bacterium]